MAQTETIDSRTALLDAAERLLIKRGHAALSVRVVATEAGVNHGLVRYYFGTLDGLLLEAFRQFTEQLFERQRELYARDVPFIEKWREAMGYLEETDRDTGYSKLWLEMQAMSWNRPEIQEQLHEINRGWRTILTAAFAEAMEDYGVDTDEFPVRAIVTLVTTFNLGIQLEAVGGMTDGHRELLDMIDRMLVGLEERKAQS
ncbi:MAG: TetR/AcrR family transcriptional regulator [Acidimicrobiia bacterium]